MTWALLSNEQHRSPEESHGWPASRADRRLPPTQSSRPFLIVPIWRPVRGQGAPNSTFAQRLDDAGSWNVALEQHSETFDTRALSAFAQSVSGSQNCTCVD